jgi:hypothetical protein
MPLAPTTLASSLLDSWVVTDGHPATPVESGDRFAGAVTSWFAAAMAGPYPCATAVARRPQLEASATAAIQARDANLAGTHLALGLLGYLAGQVFGPGLASPPTAVGAAQAAFISVFSDLALVEAVRANQIAAGIHAMAISTIVVFPPVISPPAPVT